MRNALFGLILFALGWALGASASDRPLGEINGAPLTLAQIQAQVARLGGPAGEPLTPEDRREVLEQVIENEILYQEARRRGLDQDPKVKQVMVNVLLRQEVYGAVKNSDFTEAELQAYYDAHREDFIVPEKVQIKRILIAVNEARGDAEARKAAEAVRELVSEYPAQFAELAETRSDDPYRFRGGDVGFVSRAGKPGLDQAVVDRAFTMKQGELSPVFRTDEGYNVILVASRRERVERTYQQMKGSVLRKVKNDRMEALHDAYTAQLRQGAAVRVDEAAVQALDLRYQRPSGGTPVLDALEESEEP